MQNHTLLLTIKMTAKTSGIYYFRLEAHRDVIVAHMIVMTLAWVIFLPVGTSHHTLKLSSFDI